MLDINYVRENAPEVTKAAVSKQLDPQIVTQVLELDKQRRQLLSQVEECRHQVNQNAATIKKAVQTQATPPAPTLIAKGKKLKEQLKKLERQLDAVEQEFQQCQYHLPNVPAADVPVGRF